MKTETVSDQRFGIRPAEYKFNKRISILRINMGVLLQFYCIEIEFPASVKASEHEQKL